MSRECPTNPREASGLDPEAVHLDLLREGVDADGIDISGEMLAVLREKAAEEGLDPQVQRADVTDFDPPREYALAIVPFRAFLHLLTAEEQLSALTNLHDALEPGGRLALNFFVPNPEIVEQFYGEWQEEAIKREGQEYTLRTLTELADPVEQIVHERRELYDSDGEQVFDAAYTLKWLSKREFELLARLSPFEEWEVYGDFEWDPLESADQEQVWILKR